MASALLFLLGACSEPEAPPASAVSPAATPAAAPAPPPAAASAPARAGRIDYQPVLAAPGRPAADREQDPWRKPAESLAFFGVRPGMVVLDLFAGGGYYTEILAAAVGPAGHVVAHNNEAYLDGVGDELTRRFADSRLPNVEQVTAEANELELTPGRFDFVLLSAVYHDVYYVNEARNWPKIDGPRLLAELFESMKPGATLGVIDHAAAPGSPAETGGTLHRIDPEIVKRDFAAAGFVLDTESDVLRNPSDDFTKNVFDPAVRAKTDRFLLRFRRP
jgi:predicted methyltransferase